MYRLAGFIALFAGSSLLAEINPRYYVEMQKKSPEHLRVKVTRVQNESCNNCETFKTEVTAVVTKVIRTKAKLKKGREVTFSYSVFRPREGWVGPRPMPLLEKDQEYDFFGTKTGVDDQKRIVLQPGARGYSFDSLVGED